VSVALLIHLQALAAWLLQSYTGEKLVLDLRSLLFRHVQKLSLAYHDQKGTADSIYRIQYDTPAIQQVTVDRLVPLLTSITTFGGMIYVMVRIDWQVAVVALAITPLLAGLNHIFSARLRRRWMDVSDIDSEANSVIQEVLTSIRVVKSFGREEHEHDRFIKQSWIRANEQLKAATMQGLFDLMVGVSLAAGTAGALYIGVQHVQSGAITVGGLLVMITYIAQLYQPLSQITKRLAAVQKALAGTERAFALLDEVSEVPESAHPHPLHRAEGAIAFENVVFGYSGGAPILRDVSFRVESGTKVGIQGKTGAGKSTLLSLLVRFYDVEHGRILLDGVDVRDYRIADLRSQFSIVLQDSILFSTSIRENIAYADPHASQADIERAATLANAHEFILDCPNGYDTMVGERGMLLSGGQRQRIALARAFLRDAPILIMDEPTSSLDTETERAIMEAMERLMAGRTVFLVAHRLSTLEGCQLRLNVEDGTVRAWTPLLTGAKEKTDAF
jgi:ATP-binding cassette subfamily B protein